MKLLLYLFCAFGFAADLELFCDWAVERKGFYPLCEGEPEEAWPLPNLLRKKVIARGDEMKCWEIDAHRDLVRWEYIKSFEDLSHYFGLTQKNPTRSKYWMFWNLGPKMRELDLSTIPKEKLVLVMWEPPTVQPELYDPKVQEQFGKIFTWHEELVDDKKFFKILYPAFVPQIANIPSFDEKKLCVMIARRFKSKYPNELYSKRIEVARFFDSKPAVDFDLYGYFWEREKLSHWRGPLLGHKLDKLKEYRFCICYENLSEIKGYITEKIFDCFAAGCVPVYWGASNVAELIPANCFIDRRRFGNDEEMYQYLKTMKKETFDGYQERIAAYLKSEEVKIFTAEYFLENYLSKLYGVAE